MHPQDGAGISVGEGWLSRCSRWEGGGVSTPGRGPEEQHGALGLAHRGYCWATTEHCVTPTVPAQWAYGAPVLGQGWGETGEGSCAAIQTLLKARTASS